MALFAESGGQTGGNARGLGALFLHSAAIFQDLGCRHCLGGQFALDDLRSGKAFVCFFGRLRIGGGGFFDISDLRVGRVFLGGKLLHGIRIRLRFRVHPGGNRAKAREQDVPPGAQLRLPQQVLRPPAVQFRWLWIRLRLFPLLRRRMRRSRPAMVPIVLRHSRLRGNRHPCTSPETRREAPRNRHPNAPRARPKEIREESSTSVSSAPLRLRRSGGAAQRPLRIPGRRISNRADHCHDHPADGVPGVLDHPGRRRSPPRSPLRFSPPRSG